MKKTISLILLLCMLLSCVTSGYSVFAQELGANPVGADSDKARTGEDYALPQDCKDGNILHCFNWSLAQIKAELPNIAAAGFTSVQTSPLQAHTGSSKWYWLYQPNGFSIGNELGSYNDLKSLCTEADKYGIKIIVDVVANHVAGGNNGSWAGSVENRLRKSEYFHNEGAMPAKPTRYEITHKNIGMPDLNSEHKDVRDMVYTMLEQLKGAGVDGIRWDAAKHIGLSSEDCAFWSEMAQLDLFQYGEILNNPADNSGSTVNNALMAEYAQYIGVTDSVYSTDIMSAVKSGTTLKSAGNWNKYGVSPDKIVYWAESHDTYANSDAEAWTKNIDQNLIDKAYAILGARAQSQALYLSRPFQKNKESITYPTKGSTHFTSREVAAVNHFHNAMIGTEEKYSVSSGCYVVWRERGAVIVSKNSDVDVSVSNSGSMVPVGTYVDEVSGNVFTVDEKKITGHVGASGIAVLYNGTPPEEPPVERILGDSDGNGEVESIDAAILLRVSALIPVDIEDDTLMNGDVNNDGDTDTVDATFIQRYLNFMPTPFPIGEPISPDR